MKTNDITGACTYDTCKHPQLRFADGTEIAILNKVEALIGLSLSELKKRITLVKHEDHGWYAQILRTRTEILCGSYD